MTYSNAPPANVRDRILVRLNAHDDLVAACEAIALPRINGRCRLCLCEGLAGDHLPECPVPAAEAALAKARP